MTSGGALQSGHGAGFGFRGGQPGGGTFPPVDQRQAEGVSGQGLCAGLQTLEKIRQRP